jgi:hypothetical protein
MITFDIVNGKAVINPSILLVEELRVVYDKDKSKDKELSSKHYTYIYMMADKMSMYMDIPYNNRKDMVMKSIGLKDIPDYVEESIDVYKMLNYSTEMRMVDTITMKIDEFNTFIRETEIDVDTAKILMDISKNVKTLMNDKIAMIELAERISGKENRMRGDKKQSVMGGKLNNELKTQIEINANKYKDKE